MILAHGISYEFADPRCLAEELGEHEDFGELVHLCECGGRAVQ